MNLGRLYGFIDTAYLAERDPAEVTQALIDGGVDIIQVRAKDSTHAQRVQLSRAVINVASRHKIPVIINDDLDAALECGADGVHLGQEDWAVVPREKLDGVAIIGISTHSLTQALQAERDGANYIGVGPVFATGTKPHVKPVGVELVKQVTGRVSVPFFAIGGITLQNINEVREAGAKRMAVVSAILKTPDVAQAARKFKEKLS